MERISKILLFLLLTGSLCACGGKADTSQFMIQNMDGNRYATHMNNYKNGSIHIAYQGSSKVASFLDYETMQSVPLCNKPNCAHKDGSCLAFQCVSKNDMCIVYQDYIYWFNTDSGIVEAEDGKDTDYYFDTTCYRSNISTGEIETFAKIPDVSMRYAIEFVIADNVLYVMGCESAYQEEDGTWIEESNCGNQYLYAIDLQSAEVENYGLINDTPTAYYNWTLNGHMYTRVELAGIYRDKLYMTYRYVENPDDIIDYVDEKEPDDETQAPDWSDSATAIPWHRANKCLNLKTKEIEISDLPAADLIQDENYIYYEDGNYHVMDAEGNITTSHNIEMDGESYMTFVNKKLWKGAKDRCFDTETEQDFYLRDKYQGKNIVVHNYYNNKYIVSYGDENGNIQFESVPEEELIGDAI